MNQFKRAQVLLLETKGKSIIWSHKGRRLYYNQANFNDIDDEIRYNIYIISDDEIKEGDYSIVTLDNNKQLAKVIEVDKINSIYQVELLLLNKANISVFKKEIEKIIATTDTSLEIYDKELSEKHNTEVNVLLPEPSSQFITKYIEEYNKGNIITKVLVEYYRKEYCSEENYTILPDRWKWDLKINSKDNTITIKKLKDNWNREEVTNLIKSFANNYQYASNDIGYNKWINENL